MAMLESGGDKIFSRHQRALCHLRERKSSDRLALFLGAGVSRDLGFPGWNELVNRIESCPQFKNYSSSQAHDESLTIRTQSLLQHLRHQHRENGKPIDAAVERKARAEWISTVHACLYREAATDSELLDHPYLSSFLTVIKESPLTINYNFDDSVERMMDQAFSHEKNEKNERLYETVWEPSTQFQRSKGVVYHPNGFLPKKLIDGASENIVFAEGEFADQLLDAMRGHYATLVSHLSRYTALLIGLSLEDPTLRQLLRQNTHLNPGHIHYWICRCDTVPNEVERKRQQEINFEVYGVVTLHLTEKEIPAFGRLLACSEEDFNELADRYGACESKVYYVTGPVGSGKTSVVHKLKSLSWIGEWVDPKLELLAKPHVELDEKERNEVDSWISKQFRKKNFRIADINRGVIVSDRSPLDPLAFAKANERADRARDHLNEIVPGKATRRLVPGHVIFLSASGQELVMRTRHRHANATAQYLEQQEETMRELYKVGCAEVSEVSTSGRSLEEVVRVVARIIHLDECPDFDIHRRLEEMAYGERS